MSQVRTHSTLFLFGSLLIVGSGPGCSGSRDDSDRDGDETSGTGAMESGGGASGGADFGGTGSGSANSSGGAGSGSTGGEANLSEDYQGGPCPPEAPEPGTACEDPAAYCTYGGSERPGCRQAFNCYPSGSGSGSWRVDTNPADGCLVVSGPCSTTPEGSCEQVGNSCYAGEEICTCSPEQTETCGGAGCTTLDPPIPQQWSCNIPYVGPGCPQIPPNAGTQCGESTFNCRYGADCSGIYVACRDGYYEWEDALCP